METRAKYPERVTKGEDGVWRWTAVISRAENRHAISVTLKVVGAMCLFLIGLSASMRDRQMLLVTVLACGGVMAVTGAVCAVADRMAANGRYQAFEITDDHMRWVGVGRTDFRYSWRSIRSVRVFEEEDVIEIRQLLGVMQIYVPHEDFALVKDLILARVSGSADVEYV